MRLIKSSFEILEQAPGIDGMYKQIELAGRTCYKSQDKITEDSAKGFVDRMIKSGHTAMLEHGTVYLDIVVKDTNKMDNYSPINYRKLSEYLSILNKNPYTVSKIVEVKRIRHHYITTNYRVIIENALTDIMKYWCEPTKHHAKRRTVLWYCDRVTGESFLRHRVFSFARESTRYCNFSKDKFGNEITYIIPSWVNIPEGKYTDWDNDWCDVSELKLLYPEVDNLNDSVNAFLQSIKNSEFLYFTLLNNGWKPQQARQVLPFALYSPLVMTGFEDQWTHFFELRCAPSAHPDAQKLAKNLLVKFNDLCPGKFADLFDMYIDNDEDKDDKLEITVSDKKFYMNKEDYDKSKKFRIDREQNLKPVTI